MNGREYGHGIARKGFWSRGRCAVPSGRSEIRSALIFRCLVMADSRENPWLKRQSRGGRVNREDLSGDYD